MFDSPLNLTLGLLSGLVFGFLLQKGRVAKYHVILGQFLFRDWTVMKVMLTATAVGAIGVWAMIAMGMATLQIKTAAFAPVILGSILFGAGMALFGYCPGTGVAACGEGRRDAMVGVAGMLAGAFAYVAVFPLLQDFTKAWGDAGKVTLPQLLGASPWMYVAVLAAIALLVRVFAEPRQGVSP